MLELGIFEFNYEIAMVWLIIFLWAMLLFSMPKRALLGLTLGLASCVVFVLVGGFEGQENSGEKIYIGMVFFMGFIFTACMSPLAIISFFIGYKMAK